MQVEAAAAIVDATAPNKTATSDNGADEIDPADERPAPSSATVGELVGAAEENERASRGELESEYKEEEEDGEREGEIEGGRVTACEIPPSAPSAAKGAIAPLTTRE